MCRWTSAINVLMYGHVLKNLKQLWLLSVDVSLPVCLMQWGVHVSKLPSDVKRFIVTLSLLPYITEALCQIFSFFFCFYFIMAWHATYTLPGNEWKTLCWDIWQFITWKYLTSHWSEICQRTYSSQIPQLFLLVNVLSRLLVHLIDG